MLNADLENFTIDQFAGALALSLGAIGSLLLVIWQSKCHCRINLCWLFTCERKPGPDEDKDKKDKKGKKVTKDLKDTSITESDSVSMRTRSRMSSTDLSDMDTTVDRDLPPNP